MRAAELVCRSEVLVFMGERDVSYRKGPGCTVDPAAPSAANPSRRVVVLDMLGAVRANVSATGVSTPGQLARAAGLPQFDPEGRAVSYTVRRCGVDAVQILPRLTAGASPRLRRLMADYQLIRNEFTGHPYVNVQPAGGNPPERYIITYNINGVQAIDRNQRPIISRRHVADIYLHRGYPREKPKSVLRTPLFHPNFGSYICIADHWAPGETLVDVIVHIGRMIQYQVYNPDSPLDGTAARWARVHEHLFPVGDVPLYQPELDISLGGAQAAAGDEEIIILDPDTQPKPGPKTTQSEGDDLVQFRPG